jgi:hypothetical protein
VGAATSGDGSGFAGVSSWAASAASVEAALGCHDPA